MADAYMADHPNVKINITVMENEAFKAALQTNIQAGDVPDLFQSWGGGVSARSGRGRRGAGHHGRVVGLRRRPRARRGRAVPSRRQAVRRARTTPAWSGSGTTRTSSPRPASTRPPATWDELLADVQTLKDAGITPIAVGAGDKWPAHFWYSYLMVRLGGADAMNKIAADNNFSVPNVIEAGEKVEELVALEPVPGRLPRRAGWDAPDGESGTMASGGAAMDLMGQWAPGAFQQPGRRRTGRSDLPFELGWFPFPSVDGGAGAADRRVRRRRRLRRRQGRPAGGGRLPEVHHQRRQPADVGARTAACRPTRRRPTR